MSTPPDATALQRVQSVHDRYGNVLMSLPHVVGIGVGFASEHGHSTDEVALIVLVDQKVPQNQLAPEGIVPRYLDGVRVDVQEMGHFGAL